MSDRSDLYKILLHCTCKLLYILIHSHTYNYLPVVKKHQTFFRRSVIQTSGLDQGCPTTYHLLMTIVSELQIQLLSYLKVFQGLKQSTKQVKVKQCKFLQECKCLWSRPILRYLKTHQITMICIQTTIEITTFKEHERSHNFFARFFAHLLLSSQFIFFALLTILT